VVEKLEVINSNSIKVERISIKKITVKMEFEKKNKINSKKKIETCYYIIIGLFRGKIKGR